MVRLQRGQVHAQWADLGRVWAETRKVKKTFVYFLVPKLDPTDKNQ